MNLKEIIYQPIRLSRIIVKGIREAYKEYRFESRSPRLNEMQEYYDYLNKRDKK